MGARAALPIPEKCCGDAVSLSRYSSLPLVLTLSRPQYCTVNFPVVIATLSLLNPSQEIFHRRSSGHYASRTREHNPVPITGWWAAHIGFVDKSLIPKQTLFTFSFEFFLNDFSWPFLWNKDPRQPYWESDQWLIIDHQINLKGD